MVSPDGDTELFDIHAGVMQGDTLAPFLFVIVLDYALTKAIAGREEELGLTLTPRRSRRTPAKSICDLDFADDIVLMSNLISQATELLRSVEGECKIVGLNLNIPKTKAMYFNTEEAPITNLSAEKIDQALTKCGDQDFKYLGSWCEKARDIITRKALAWRALHKMDRIWKSELDDDLKIDLFRATVESILLFGSQTWSLTKAEEKSLNGTYTRMLRAAKNIHWSEKITNKNLYGKLKPVSEFVRERRMRLAGHVLRDLSSPAHMTITWQPTHGRASRGRPETTFVDMLLRDTNLDNVTELENCMMDKNLWTKLCGSRSASYD